MRERAGATRGATASYSHSRRRAEGIKRGWATAIGTRGFTAIVALVSVPIALNYLGPSNYGAWIALVSLTSFLSVSDLGLGNSLVGEVAYHTTQPDSSRRIRRDISSAACMLTVVALTLALLFVGVSMFVDWSELIAGGRNADRLDSMFGVAAAVFGVYIVSIPLSIATNVRAGLQQGYANNLASASGSAVSLIFLVLMVRLRSSIPLVVFAAASAPLLSVAMNATHLFWTRRDLRPGLRFAERARGMHLLRVGLLFLALQLVGAVAFSSDAFVVARLLGPSAAADFAVPHRLFAAVASVLSVGTASLWPAFVDAFGRHDDTWIRSALVRAIAWTAVGSGLIGGLLVAVGASVLERWVGTTVVVDMNLLRGLAAWLVLSSVGNVAAMFLIAARVIRFQIVWGSVMAISNIALSIVLAQRVGVSGVIWGSVISYTMFTLLPYAFKVPVVLHQHRA